jgi:UDP-glucose 4-epimerase
MSRRILVTGAAGALGRLVVQMLHEAGDRVHALDNRREGQWPDAVAFHHADVRKRGFDQALREARPDAVIHLARVRGFEIDPAFRHRVNYEGATRAIDRSIAAGVKKIVLVSRHTVYGALPDQAQFLTEEHPPSAGRTFPEIHDLVAADLYAQGVMWRHPETETVVLRPVNIVGPTSRPLLARYLERPRTFTVAGFDPVYQVIHERDAARAVVGALAPGVRGVFNVVGCGEVPLSVLVEETGGDRIPMPEALIKVLSGRLGFPKIPQGAIDFLKHPCTVDGARFRDETGFEAEVGLAETLASARSRH